MSFKTLQNALFQLSGSRAMPNVSNTLRYDPRESPFTLTAPDDGYMCAEGVSIDAKNEISINNSNVRSSQFSSQTWGARCFVPVHKGDQINVIYTGFNIQTAALYFTKLMGGGLRAFLRRLFGVCGEVQYA